MLIPRTAPAILGACLLLLAFATALPIAANSAEPTAAKVAIVRYELEKVEQKAKQAAGSPFEWTDRDREIFRQVREFAEQYPDSEAVMALVERARTAYQASGGNRFEITDEMLAYRDKGKEVESVLGRLADEAWAEYQQAQAGSFFDEPFPAPDPLEVDDAALAGKKVILEDVPYEENLFVENGRNHVASGDPARGYYWIAGSSPHFNRLYEAMRRYRTSVKEVLPAKWTLVCQFAGPELLTPDGSDEGSGFTSHIGWTANPTAIYIPGVLFATLDEDAEGGATFTGEEKLDELMSYSITEVPEQVTPEELVRIYITAIKEKNFDLHIECHTPENRSHTGQIQTLRYYWEVQQKGLEKIHAHAEPIEIGEIRVVQGAADQDLDAFFGDPNKGGKKALPKIEKCIVTVQLYNADGIQTVRPRYITLIRHEGGRWGIWSGGTLTF